LYFVYDVNTLAMRIATPICDGRESREGRGVLTGESLDLTRQLTKIDNFFVSKVLISQTSYSGTHL